MHPIGKPLAAARSVHERQDLDDRADPVPRDGEAT
jgi:hypothetical protein